MSVKDIFLKGQSLYEDCRLTPLNSTQIRYDDYLLLQMSPFQEVWPEDMQISLTVHILNEKIFGIIYISA